MDSIMKKVHILLCFIWCVALSSFGQDWQSFHINTNSTLLGWTKGGSWDRKFKVNHYDSSMWFLNGSNLIHVANNGSFLIFNPSNTSLFNTNNEFLDVTFTPNEVYLVDRYQGIYRYKDNTWLKISNLTEGVHLASDGDTVWCSRVNQPFLIIESFNIDFGSVYVRRSVSRNGEFWGSNGADYGSLVRSVDQNNFLSYFSSTTPGLMDGKNYHFKFPPNSELFYTSGDLGISIADNGVFNDSIHPSNFANMPELAILEFEFDENDNIWAVFGEFNIVRYPQKIGFYDRVLDEWTMIFDENNSPIVFENKPVSIEIDPWGNLWVVNGQYLHVLKQGEDPGWLSTLSNEVQLDYQVYPNPAREKLTIVIPENAEVQSLILSDLFGKLIAVNSIEKNQTIELDIAFLQTGCYLLEVTGKNGSKKIIRWIKE
jgi:hypothetical protein